MSHTIHNFFALLDLTPLDADLYTTLIELGVQPASVVARRVNIERTKAYRHLIKMVEIGIMSTTSGTKTTQFFVESTDGLERLVRERQKLSEKMAQQKEQVFDEIRSVAQHDLRIPKVQTFQRPGEIKHLFEDILRQIRDQGILSIRMFASNTFEEQQAREVNKQIIEDFFSEIEALHVRIESFIGVGSLIMERIEKWTHSHNFSDLPATGASIHMFVVGDAIYIVIYRDSPIGIKISGELIVDAFHALLDAVERGVQN